MLKIIKPVLLVHLVMIIDVCHYTHSEYEFPSGNRTGS